MSGESVLVGGTAWWEPIENPKPELAHLPFGMSFEKSDRLVQAFRVDMFPGALTGFFRFGCTPCASWLFAALGFQLVILFHTPLPAIVAFYKSRQGRIGQVLFLSARECSNCGVARPLITPTTFVSAISFPSYLRHAAAWFSGVSSPRSTTSGTDSISGPEAARDRAAPSTRHARKRPAHGRSRKPTNNEALRRRGRRAGCGR
jgi:hypothetical protein